ncbi:MAG: sigma-70 family RNA polymerase sigma factor [Lentisphaeria bacterium]|nr:sigma-70 family RNA polymerase sigma factor [Lentisphaeria bacterium]
MGSIDIATIHACRQGDPDAARRIHSALQSRVYALAYRYTNDADQALDLSQEVLLRVFSRIGTFRAESSLETWVYRIAVNTILGKLRYERWCEKLPEDLAESRTSARPERRLANEELGETIARAVSELPDSLRIVFVLVAIEHLPYPEVAQLLSLSVEAVRMRMSRARAQLRDRLRPYITEGDNDEL